MSRDMGGTGFITTGIGGLVGIPGGALTIYAICRVTVDSTFRPIVSFETSANSSRLSFWLSNTNTIQLTIVASDKDTTVPASSSDGWMLVAVTKAAGSSTPRGHKYVYSSNAWTHTNAGAATGGDSGDLTGGRVQIGRYQSTSERWSGDLMLVGAIKRALTDTEIEQLPYTLAGNLAVVPDALWLLDQSDTAQNVLDLTGGGANQTALTSTSVSSTSMPVFNYGAGPTIGIGQAGGGGPTQYNQSVSGAVTPAGALLRQAGKPLAGALTPAGALVRQCQKRLAGAATPAAALARQTGKTLAGALTPAGALATLKAALRSFSGALTPSGTLTRQVGKALGGTLAPAGSLRRLTARTLVGTLGAVGTLVKQTARRFSGALSPSGAVATSTGPPPTVRDLRVVVGAPESRWTVGPPSGRWSTGQPQPKWTARPPEV